MTNRLTLVEGADLIGRHRYVELALFSCLGARAADCERADVAIYLSGASLAHAWRAGLAESVLPVSPDLAAREWTRTPGSAFDEALGVLFAPGDDELLDATLGVVYPAMVDGYTWHLEVASDVSDGPVKRVLRRAIADLEAVISEAPELGSVGGETARAKEVGELLASVPGVFGEVAAIARRAKETSR